jgi:hypothetical protein
MHHVTRQNTPIHNILSTAPQLKIKLKEENGIGLVTHYTKKQEQ